MKRFTFLLLTFICVFMITNNKVYADTVPVIYQSFEEPVTGDNAGYITYLMRHKSTGVYWSRTYAWTYSGPDTSFLKVTPVVYSDKIHIHFVFDNSEFGQFANMSFYAFWGNETEPYLQSASVSSYTFTDETPAYEINYSNSNYECVGYIYKGNIYELTNNLSNSNIEPFVVVWGSEYVSLQKYNDMIFTLRQILLQDTSKYAEAIDALNQLISSSDNIDTKLANIYDLMERYLSDIYSEVSSIDDKLNQIDTKMDRIIEILEEWSGLSGTESTEPLPEDTITENEEKHDNLFESIGGNDFNFDFSVDFDASTNTTIWDYLTLFLQANSKIFTLCVSVLSLGLVSLILNR